MRKKEICVAVKPPTRLEQFTMRLLIFCGLCWMLFFLIWFFKPAHIGFAPLWVLLTLALLFKLLKMLHEWYHYWDLSTTPPPVLKKAWTVDVFTTACSGEPFNMIDRTLRAIQAITYPHKAYLCDESNNPALRSLCESLGVIHVTRLDKTDAKAGNINNALKRAVGEVCVILDPDHEPVPHMLDRLLPYFEDGGVGFVQSVQAYSNQGESLVARGAAEQTYHFYGPMMMCMNSYGTVQAIGANCAFRRAALDSIGGHAPGLAEDMHTAMQLHAKGWTSVYVPEILTRGLVPASLSAYYAQQLKWSRGTFELLFRVYPLLRKQFTWRQQLHYFLLPVYFLFGLITLIDLSIPVAALLLARTPWSLDMGRMALIYLPLLALSIGIRRFSQRWLLEPHEQGFHLPGGMLRTATWWVYLLGFVYAVFRVKVPYIPTPKQDEHRNHWLLSVPNMLAVFISLSAIVYGLSLDWSPYSLSMAGFALLNAALLSVVVISSQQQLGSDIQAKIPWKRVLTPLLETWYRTHRGLRYSSMFVLLLIALVFWGYKAKDDSDQSPTTNALAKRGGFYIGIQSSAQQKQQLPGMHPQNANPFDIVSFEDNAAPNALSKRLDSIRKRASLPFFTWHPSDRCSDFCAAVLRGKKDEFLGSYAKAFLDFGDPIMLSFALDSTNTTRQTPMDPALYRKAWQYISLFFLRQGVSNVTWVWAPSLPINMAFYPGDDVVDWIAPCCFDSHEEPLAFAFFRSRYAAARVALSSVQKPILLALPSVQESAPDLTDFVNSNAELGGLLFPASATNAVVYDSLRESIRAQSMHQKPYLYPTALFLEKKNPPTNQRYLQKTPQGFALLVDGKPFYMRGVAYNPAHDWRDGNTPLTRQQLEHDFKAIKEMGANTLRRYGPGFYDRNILNIAKEYDLKVLYGFNFDPKKDYACDTLQLLEYRKQVIDQVLRYRDYPAVLGWVLGNETWGLLKQQFGAPYLTVVRRNYLRMIEHLAQEIHKLDPNHPVFTCMEHAGYQLGAELTALRLDAPSLDAVGINSYYKPLISAVHETVQKMAPERPYFVSEFGPNGYWDKDYNLLAEGRLHEQSELEKADWYQRQWLAYILPYRGDNLGGVAYCWSDRYEGSETWFGLTDFKGRRKPSYYSLKACWTGNKANFMPSYSILMPPKMRRGGRYLIQAKGLASISENTDFTWSLLADEYMQPVDALTSQNPGEVLLTVPAKGKNLRLYLYADDKLGRVSTASAPIIINEK